MYQTAAISGAVMEVYSRQKLGSFFPLNWGTGHGHNGSIGHQNPGWLIYTEGITLPRYMGVVTLITNQKKDPY